MRMTQTQTMESGGGLIEIVVIGGLIVLGASVLGSVAAAIAGALAALIAAVMWAAFSLAALLGLVLVAWVAVISWRLYHHQPIRRIGRPRPAALVHRSQPAVITDAPPRPQLNGHVPRMHPEDLAELARQIRGGR